MIFDEAIKEMDRSGLTQSNPRNFLDYCKKFNDRYGTHINRKQISRNFKYHNRFFENLSK